MPEEEELHLFASRSLQAIKKIRSGEILKEGINFEVLRSGKQSRGKDARFLMEVNGKTASKDYEIGEGIIQRSSIFIDCLNDFIYIFSL